MHMQQVHRIGVAVALAFCRRHDKPVDAECWSSAFEMYTVNVRSCA
jgi:hypothetical protein